MEVEGSIWNGMYETDMYEIVEVKIGEMGLNVEVKSIDGEIFKHSGLLQRINGSQRNLHLKG